MHQIIEGLDNEVALLIFFSTAVIAIVFPLYIVRIFYPRTENPSRREPENETTPPDQTSLESTPQPTNNQQGSFGQTNTADQVSSSPLNMAASPEASSPTNISGEELGESFVIRVKYHEETQDHTLTRIVKLRELKEKCFPEQFSQGKLIRFVHAGKLVTGDDQTLEQLGIAKPCVLQCVISDQNNTGTSSSGGVNETDGSSNELLDLSFMLYVCYALLVLGSWLLLFLNGDWFSNAGMFILSLLSVIGYFLIFSV